MEKGLYWYVIKGDNARVVYAEQFPNSTEVGIRHLSRLPYQILNQADAEARLVRKVSRAELEREITVEQGHLKQFVRRYALPHLRDSAQSQPSRTAVMIYPEVGHVEGRGDEKSRE